MRLKEQEFKIWYNNLPKNAKVALGLLTFGFHPMTLWLYEIDKKKRLEDFVLNCWVKKLNRLPCGYI